MIEKKQYTDSLFEQAKVFRDLETVIVSERRFFYSSRLCTLIIIKITEQLLPLQYNLLILCI